MKLSPDTLIEHKYTCATGEFFHVCCSTNGFLLSLKFPWLRAFVCFLMTFSLMYISGNSCVDMSEQAELETKLIQIEIISFFSNIRFRSTKFSRKHVMMGSLLFLCCQYVPCGHSYVTWQKFGVYLWHGRDWRGQMDLPLYGAECGEQWKIILPLNSAHLTRQQAFIFFYVKREWIKI